MTGNRGGKVPTGDATGAKPPRGGSQPSLRERYDADDWWATLTPNEMVAVWKAHALCPPGCEWPWSDRTCPEHGRQR